MSKTAKAIRTIEHIDELNSRDRWMNKLHPLVKLFVVILYIAFIMNFSKYEIRLTILMAVVPVCLFVVSDLSLSDAVKRLKYVLPVVLLVGVINLFMDKREYMIGDTVVPAGLISMLVLTLKGVYAVFMAYFLIATTSIEKLCAALRKIHIPKTLVLLIMLTYRYVTLLLGEADRVTTAYRLRAPGQKGVHFSAWGSLVGQFLIRSFDRAQAVYEAMELRGFDGEYKSLD